MADDDFTADPLLEALRRLGTAIDRFDEAVARRLDVHRSDLRALQLLEHGPVSAGAIAEHLDLTSGSVTALVGRLVDASLVTRTVDTIDRRVVNVALRPTAWSRLANAYGPAGKAVADYSAQLSERRRNETKHALHALAEVFDQTRQR